MGLDTHDSLILYFCLPEGSSYQSEDELLGVDGLARILQSLNYPQTPLDMGALAEELLKFSNDIRLQDGIAIIEMRFLGQSPSD